MIFKYDQLRLFYNEIKKRGKTELFRSWNGDNAFLVRHDVDFDIKLAYDMAVIEREHEVVSTFFILTTCDSYNVMSKKNRTMLKEMINMGHEIGLHFDPTLYASNMELALDEEVKVLSFATQNEVRSISLHNPSVHGQYPMFKNYINAYDAKIFSDETYISDSRFDFRNKNPFEFINNIDKGPVQILLHPLHYSEKGEGYDAIFYKSFVRYMSDIHENFMGNSTYREQVGSDFMNNFKKHIT